MKLEDVRKALDHIRPGCFFRIGFYSDVPLKAEFKKQGYAIRKVTWVTTRTGICYSHIKGVQFSLSSSPKVNNFVWEKKHYLSYNTATKKYYLNIYPISRGAGVKTVYMVFKDGVQISSEKDDTMILPSYLNNDRSTKICKINIENIISIA